MQEVLGKEVFNAEVKEAVAEVLLFHPRHHFHLAPGLLLPRRHLHQGGGENDCGAHLGSGFQSASMIKVRQMARRKLCIKMVHITGRVAWLEEVPAGKEGAREQASTLFLLSLFVHKPL